VFDYYDLDFEGKPQIPTDIDLASPHRWFATSGRRTLRTRERGGAQNLENVLIGGFADDRIAGNASGNSIQAGGGRDTIDCRGGRDTVLDEPGDRLTQCEVVKTYR
jgi:Ca2+-binding RTX toxin-like protein